MVHYFVFDQFNPSNSRDYWKTEPGVELPVWIRYIAEEELVPVFPRIKSSDWKDGDYIAFMKKNRLGRVCLFRVYSGGLDTFGRANRWVMLLAEGSHEDFAGTDILSAVEWGVFEEFKAISCEKKLSVPINIIRRDWPKVATSSWNLLSETLQISDADTLRKVSLALTSNSCIAGTIWMQKIGESLNAKLVLDREKRPEKRADDLGKMNQTKIISEDRKRIPLSGNRRSRCAFVLSLSLAFFLGALIPTWLWYRTKEDNMLLKEKNGEQFQQISLKKENYERQIRRLERDLKSQQEKNSSLKNENERLKEKLLRHEFVIVNAEKLERYATELRKNVDECTQKISEVLNEICRESD